MNRLVAVLLIFITGFASASIDKLVVFGDSLSDNGNMYNLMDHQLPSSPPYYNGRFTNGLVWVELLSESLFPKEGNKHLLDYAYGGAGIIPEQFEDDSDMALTLSHEVYLYLKEHNDKADPNSLYIIWIGANNYLNLPDDETTEVTEVIAGIKRATRRLVSNGAKHILVLNLPDLGRTPAGREFSAEAELSAMVNLHNDALLKAVDELRAENPAVEWLHFDTFTGVNEIMSSPEQYGFTNIFDTCYESDVEELSNTTILKMASSINSFVVKKDACAGSLFFDLVHPTEPAHKLIAQEIFDLLKAKGVEFTIFD